MELPDGLAVRRDRGEPRASGSGNALEVARAHRTVLLAAEHRLFRAAVGAALGQSAGFDVVEEAADGVVATDMALRLVPAVAMLEASLPGRDGVEACKRIKAAGLGTKVILVTPAAELPVLLAGLEAGADGFVDTRNGLAELLAACRAVLRGESFVPGGMLAMLLRGLIEGRRRDTVGFDLARRLRPREREVLALLVQGHDHQGVARALVVSPATARTHIQNVLKKLQVHSRLEAISLAIEYGLVEVE